MTLITSACINPISFINVLLVLMIFTKRFHYCTGNEICFKTNGIPDWYGSVAGRHPAKQKVTCVIPHQARAWVFGQVPSGVCERQPIDVSLTHPCLSPSLSPSLSLSLKKPK